MILEQYTWREYQQLAETLPEGYRIGFLKGTVYIMPPPSQEHEIGVALLFALLSAIFAGKSCKFVGSAGISTRLSGEFSPDISLVIGSYAEGVVPDIVGEKTRTSKITEAKLQVFFEAGVKEVWELSKDNQILLRVRGANDWVISKYSKLTGYEIERLQHVIEGSKDTNGYPSTDPFVLKNLLVNS